MPFNIRKTCYTMSQTNEGSTEITMYGEIVEARPVDWWTGKEVPGDYIIQSEFLEDLETALAKGKPKKLTLRMNSIGGDAGVSILIHNRLREIASDGTKIECIVDGVAMSGGSLIMCAADTVKVYPSSIVMIHKCWAPIFGAYNADELRAEATQRDAWDKAQCNIYTGRTKLSETKILHMMSETTNLVGKEAVDNGFADEVIEDRSTVAMCASANRTMIYVNGRALHLARGMKAPETLPIMEEETVSTSAEDDINTQSGSDTDDNKGGNTPMATNLEELRAENPELAAQVESDLRAAVSAEHNTALETAVANERSRIQQIDEISSLYGDDIVADAKYGEHACTAQEMAFRAAQAAAKNGTAFMANVAADNKASGANEVPAASAPEDAASKSEAQKRADTKEAVHNLFHKEDK